MPGGSGGGIPGNGGCTGLAFWRFFSGRDLANRVFVCQPASRAVSRERSCHKRAKLVELDRLRDEGERAHEKASLTRVHRC